LSLPGSHSHGHPHVEGHFESPEIVRDVVIGMADGLTVPFALAAGLSALSSNAIIVTAGLAEITAGSIAMGLGGYLAAKSEAEHYKNEMDRERREIRELPLHEEREIEEIFETYGVTKEEVHPLLQALKRQPDKWVDFMMRFELGLEAPRPRRAVGSALTIAVAYIVGGFVPLSPYIVYADPEPALKWSAIVTGIALFLFGWGKGRYTGVPAWKSAAQTCVVGGLAAATAFFMGRAFSA
jgi:VIT1/CCC1 family predicted Fe2+/Mn2+ transporter